MSYENNKDKIIERVKNYNKQNNFDAGHEHAARPGYAGAGMIFPRNEV